MSNAQSSVNRMFQVLSSSMLAKASINLQQSDEICSGFYSAVFSLPIQKKFSFAEFNEGFAELTDNKLSIEANSLFAIDEGLYRCILSSNSESRPLNDESLKGMIAVRASLYMDEDTEQLWRVEGEGENKRIVQQTQSDYGSLLEAKRSRTSIIASDGILDPYQEHDYAYFFNQNILAMDFGYVVSRDDKDYVLSRSTDKLVPIITPTQVVMASEPEKLKHPARQKHNMVIAGDYSLEKYLGYLRQMYGADNPFYKAYEKAIKEAAIN